jgi:hypothetical protein
LLKQILIDKKPNHEDKDDIEEVYDSGDYFKPSNDDCNSGDSNLSLPSSESNKSDDISYIKEVCFTGFDTISLLLFFNFLDLDEKANRGLLLLVVCAITA